MVGDTDGLTDTVDVGVRVGVGEGSPNATMAAGGATRGFRPCAAVHCAAGTSLVTYPPALSAE